MSAAYIQPEYYESKRGETYRVVCADSLAEAMRCAGLPPLAHAPAAMRRFGTNDDHRDDAGWLVRLRDGKGASFGDFRTGEQFVWFDPEAGSVPSFSFNTLDIVDREPDHFALASMEKAYGEASELCLDHPYVKAKRITPYAARMARDGKLLVPCFDNDGVLQTTQSISPDGTKRLFAGCPNPAGRLVIGGLVEGEPILLCEGWATGCSLREATDLSVVVCFTASYRTIVRDLAVRYPTSLLVIAADRDRSGRGETAALSAAKLHANCRVVMPDFGDESTFGDFNDLATQHSHQDVNEQIEATISLASPSHPLENGKDHAAGRLAVSDTGDPRDGTEWTHALTELGNVKRMVDLYSDQVRYVPELKRWLVWKDGGWVWDPAGTQVKNLVSALPTHIYDELKFLKSRLKDADYVTSWARSSQKNSTINSTVELMKNEPAFVVSPDVIDADDWSVGYDNARQVLNLKTGATRAARQSDYVTKSLAVQELGEIDQAYRWQTFLREIFNDDLELIDWMQRLCGYALTGSKVEPVVAYCFGNGANGKSVFLNTLQSIWGSYAKTLMPESLYKSNRQGAGASPDLVNLVGARLVVSPEVREGAQLEENRIKALVSGDVISARALYCDPVEFRPKAKLMMSGNHMPRLSGTDDGIWRRFRKVPFDRTIPDAERDPHLEETLRGEASHILAWCLRGSLEWQRRGLAIMPEAIRRATDDYRAMEDPLEEWIAEATSRSGDTRLPVLYAAFKPWCELNGYDVPDRRAFGTQLTRKGFKSRKSNGNTIYVGISPKSVSSGVSNMKESMLQPRN